MLDFRKMAAVEVSGVLITLQLAVVPDRCPHQKALIVS